MKRRVVAAALGLLTVVGPAVAVSHQQPVRTQMAGDWVCVASREIDNGVCLSDPWPERLPIPDRP